MKDRMSLRTIESSSWKNRLSPIPIHTVKEMQRGKQKTNTERGEPEREERSTNNREEEETADTAAGKKKQKVRRNEEGPY